LDQGARGHPVRARNDSADVEHCPALAAAAVQAAEDTDRRYPARLDRRDRHQGWHRPLLRHGDRRGQALYGGGGVALERGSKVRVRVEPLKLKIYCGPGQHVNILEIKQVT
jgi:hypothetical protein